MYKRLRKYTHLLLHPWQWYIRAALLWYLLSLIAPVTHRVLPEHHLVQTLKPHVCVHTDLVNEVDEWKIQRTLQLVREMGASTIVEFFPWAYVEGQEDQYLWYQADRIIDHAEQQGITIIARIGLVPDWARPRQTTLNHLPEEAFNDFAEFIADFASRYAGRVDHLIIWNEPNLAFEWGYNIVDASYYARLLQTIYLVAHRANPDVIILAGALAPTLEPVGSPNGMNDLLYLDALYEAGARDYFDALAVHTYGLTEPAEQTPSPDHLNFRRAELIYQIMQEYDDGNKPVYITESGWNDNPRWTKGVRPSQRVAYTLNAFDYVEQNWEWAQTMCLWMFRYTRPNGNYRDNFTLVTPEFQLKPIYYATQAYARGWEEEKHLWLPAPER